MAGLADGFRPENDVRGLHRHPTLSWGYDSGISGGGIVDLLRLPAQDGRGPCCQSRYKTDPGDYGCRPFCSPVAVNATAASASTLRRTALAPCHRPHVDPYVLRPHAYYLSGAGFDPRWLGFRSG